MRLCCVCRWRVADLPKDRPRFCLTDWRKIPVLQPAGPRVQAPQLKVIWRAHE